jgi:multiple sugar transport system ATP-binding protein
MAAVTLKSIRKVYENGVVAVHGADFEVQDGEFIVLVGPSGCGKSTVLRMIAGLESITEGELLIGDQQVNDLPPKDRDIAMVFQNYALYPHMSVFENMAFSLKLRKYSKAEIQARVGKAAGVLGITAILDRRPKQLSGGQRQRVAVGRAIVRDPRVFLFDEPLSNLDAQLRVQMRTEISKLHNQLGATMIYVTHDQVEAMTMGDRIVVMKEGHIQQIDRPLNLYQRPVNRFVAGFIGSPAMNFIEGRVEQEDGGCFITADRQIRLRMNGRWAGSFARQSGKDFTLGIRPEDISVAGTEEPHAGRAVVRMVLDLVEPMGNEMFLYARSSEQMVVARVAPQELPPPGSEIQLALDLEKAHLFDSATEAALRD